MDIRKTSCVLKEIVLYVQNLLTFLGSIVNFIIGGTYVAFLMAHCEWTLISHSNSRLAPKLSGKNPGFFRYICGHRGISTS
jgi:hypothetical protein